MLKSYKGTTAGNKNPMNKLKSFKGKISKQSFNFYLVKLQNRLMWFKKGHLR